MKDLTSAEAFAFYYGVTHAILRLYANEIDCEPQLSLITRKMSGIVRELSPSLDAAAETLSRCTVAGHREIEQISRQAYEALREVPDEH